MNSKGKPDKRSATMPQESERGRGALEILAWGVARSGLSLFATGWILIQTASVLLLAISSNSALGPTIYQTTKLLLSLVYAAGIVLFVSGMCLGCAVPAVSGARRWAWGTVAGLLLSAVLFAIYNAVAFYNQAIVQEIAERILNAQKQHPQAPPPAKAELEHDLAQQWGPEVLKGLATAFLGFFGVSKILFSVYLWALARHFKKPVLASGIIIYLVGEVFAVLAAVALLLRVPAPLANRGPFILVTDTWYGVAITSAFCAWFLVNVFMLRRAITQAVAQRTI